MAAVRVMAAVRGDGRVNAGILGFDACGWGENTRAVSVPNPGPAYAIAVALSNNNAAARCEDLCMELPLHDFLASHSPPTRNPR